MALHGEQQQEFRILSCKWLPQNLKKKSSFSMLKIVQKNHWMGCSFFFPFFSFFLSINLSIFISFFAFLHFCKDWADKQKA
jgi:hypothetical protein